MKLYRQEFLTHSKLMELLKFWHSKSATIHDFWLLAEQEISKLENESKGKECEAWATTLFEHSPNIEILCSHNTILYKNPAFDQYLGKYFPQNHILLSQFENILPADCYVQFATIIDKLSLKLVSREKIISHISTNDGFFSEIEMNIHLVQLPEIHDLIRISISILPERKTQTKSSEISAIHPTSPKSAFTQLEEFPLQKIIEQNELRLKAIFASANVGFAAIDLNGKFIMINQTWCNMIEYTEEELRGLSISQITHPDDVGFTIEKIQGARNGLFDNYRIEKRYVTKSGKTLWADVSVSSITNKKNELLYLLGVITDINEKKLIALENSKLLTAIDQSPTAIIITNLQGNIEYANPQFCKITGYEMHELTGSNPSVLKSGLHSKEFYRELWSTISSGKIWHGIFQNKHKNGNIFWEEATIAPVFNHLKQIINYVAIKQDITEKIAIEQKLIESEGKLKTTFDILEVGISITDEEGNIIDCNRASEKILGITKQEHLSRNYKDNNWKIVRTDLSPMPSSEYASVIALTENRPVQNVTMGIVKDDEKTSWINVSAAPLNLKGYGVAISYIDITENIHITQALLESEEKFRTYIMSSPTSVLIINNMGQFTFANPAACELLGYSTIDLLSLSFSDTLAPDYLYLIDRIFSKLQTEGFIHNLELELWGQGGKSIIVLLDGVKLSNNEYITYIKDISAQKKAEEKMLSFTRELHEMNVSKDKFLSILSHDLKNPFNSLLGFTDILARNHKRFDEEKRDRIIHTLQSVTKNTYALLENLLTWVRSQSGKITIEISVCNLLHDSQEVISLLSEISAKKHIEIQNYIQADIDVFADSNMLKTIFRNLISNAIKYTPQHGQITLSAVVQAKYVVVSVTDTGHGISESAQKSLFKVGESKSTEGTEGEKGTGLGLLLCKEFIDLHGGNIWVENSSEQGTTFSFNLPRANHKHQ